VSYVDGEGASHTYGTFSGNQQGTVNVSIFGFVNQITVSLSTGEGNQNTVSVSFTAVAYCAPGDGGCSDGDNDGVCDEVDLCPGLDDALIGTACDDGDPCTENDLYTLNCLCEGTPIPDCPPDDGCDNVLISQFSPSTLTHTGSGS